ncbi:MAG: DUF5618 family protein [Bacteroidetes bacterium]|nr:DUF5618 family protein [Bacteroidota bacterium]
MNPTIPCLPCLPDRQAAGRKHIEEAKRYLSNARDILKSKAGNGTPGFYSDKKYVKMACHTAWCGVLEALDGIAPPLPKRKRKSVEYYHDFLAKRNRKILHYFVAAYQHLHLWGGYDGNLYKKTTKAGFELAENVINWCEKN